MKTILDLLGKLPFLLKIIIMILVVVIICKFVPNLTWAIIFIEMFLVYVFLIRGNISIETDGTDNQTKNPTDTVYRQCVMRMMMNAGEETVWGFIITLNNGLLNKDPDAIQFISEPNTGNIMSDTCKVVNVRKHITLNTKKSLIDFLKSVGLSISAVPPENDQYTVLDHAAYNLKYVEGRDDTLRDLLKNVSLQTTEENTLKLINYLNSVVIYPEYSSDTEDYCYIYYIVNENKQISEHTKKMLEQALLSQGIEKEKIHEIPFCVRHNNDKLKPSFILTKKVLKAGGRNGSAFEVDRQRLWNEMDRIKRSHTANSNKQNIDPQVQQAPVNINNQQNDISAQMNNDFLQQEIMRHQTEFAMEEGLKSVTPFDMGGYVQGDGFNPSDTMAADALRQAEQMNQMNDMNNMGGMGMF